MVDIGRQVFVPDVDAIVQHQYLDAAAVAAGVEQRFHVQIEAGNPGCRREAGLAGIFQVPLEFIQRIALGDRRRIVAAAAAAGQGQSGAQQARQQQRTGKKGVGHRVGGWVDGSEKLMQGNLLQYIDPIADDLWHESAIREKMAGAPHPGLAIVAPSGAG
ncbi:MAG: hypothetical protein WBG17_02490 [Burkholderiaceae bacterium]